MTLYQLVESKAEALYGGELELWLFAIFSRWEEHVRVLLEGGRKEQAVTGNRNPGPLVIATSSTLPLSYMYNHPPATETMSYK